MLLVAVKLLGLVLLLAAMCLGLVSVIRAHWRDAPPSEVLLVSLIGVPVVLILEIVLLGSIPPGRPLRYLWVLQLLVSLSGVCLAVRCSGALREAVRQTLDGFGAGWLAASGLQRFALLLGLAGQLAATGYGAWNTPWSVDELNYHLPQALQPYQDGYLGPVQASVIWADSYPRGAALLYYWTLQLTRGDAGIHPVNGAFGFVFMLATYVAARRSGLTAGWSWLAAGIVPSAPIFAFLNTIGYIDLAVGGTLAAALAMALPERDGRWSWGSCAGCLLALMLGLWMKFPVFILGGVILAYRGVVLILARIGWKIQDVREMQTATAGGSPSGTEHPAPDVPAACAPGSSKPGPGLLAFISVAVLVLVAGSIPYLQTWRRYGTPVYPVQMTLGSRVVFEGPMRTALFGRMNDRPLLERFGTYWTAWATPVNTDTPGSFGPLFTFCMVGAAAACTLAGLRRPRRGWVLLMMAFWMVLVVPEHHVPRYALFILLPGALCCAAVGQATRERLAVGWCATLVVLQLGNVGLFAREVRGAVRWQRSFNLPLLGEERNRAIVDRVVRADGHSPTPQARQALYSLMKPGETLISAVHGYQALLHDPAYSYRVEHRPARPWPYGFDHWSKPEYGAAEAPGWLTGLRRDKVAAVLVYRGSAEDEVLRAGDSGYAPVYEEQPVPGDCAMVIHRRKASP